MLVFWIVTPCWLRSRVFSLSWKARFNWKIDLNWWSSILFAVEFGCIFNMIDFPRDAAPSRRRGKGLSVRRVDRTPYNRLIMSRFPGTDRFKVSVDSRRVAESPPYVHTDRNIIILPSMCYLWEKQHSRARTRKTDARSIISRGERRLSLAAEAETIQRLFIGPECVRVAARCRKCWEKTAAGQPREFVASRWKSQKSNATLRSRGLLRLFVLARSSWKRHPSGDFLAARKSWHLEANSYLNIVPWLGMRLHVLHLSFN